MCLRLYIYCPFRNEGDIKTTSDYFSTWTAKIAKLNNKHAINATNQKHISIDLVPKNLVLSEKSKELSKKELKSQIEQSGGKANSGIKNKSAKHINPTPRKIVKVKCSPMTEYMTRSYGLKTPPR